MGGLNMSQTHCTACGAALNAPAAGAGLVPLRFWDYLFMVFVFSVPLLGVLVASMWAFGWGLGKKTKKNRKAFSLAQFIVQALLLAACLTFYVMHFGALNEFFKVVLS